MKHLLILFAFLLSGILANSQVDVRPVATSPVSFLQVPTYSWWYNKADSTIWGRQLNNSQIPEWVKLVGANRIWWTQIEKIVAGDTTFNRVHNRDSVNMTIYKLKDDSLKLYKLKTDSVTLKGYFTNSKARYYRLLNNHDSLSKLDERKYQSLTDTLLWGLGLSQLHHIVKVDTSDASIPSRQRIAKYYRLLNDTTRLKGTATVFDLRSKVNVSDTTAMLAKYATDVNLTYKEDKSNKVTSISAASTDVQYGSAKLLYNQLVLKAPVSVYPATGLTTGYIPYKTATVLADSPMSINGTNISISSTNYGQKLNVNGNAVFGNGGVSSQAFINGGNNGYSSATTNDYSWYYDDHTGIFHPADNVIGISIGGTEAMRITTNRNFGFGLPVPLARVAIKQSANNYRGGLSVVKSDDASFLSLFYDVTSGIWNIAASYESGGSYKPIGIFTSDVERMRFLTNGNIDIGGATAGYKLGVNGTLLAMTSVTTPTILLTTGAQANYIWKSTGTSGAGAWASFSAGEAYKGVVDGDDGKINYGATALIDGTGTQGDYYRCYDAGVYNYGSGNITLAIGDELHYNGAVWLFQLGVGYTLTAMDATTLGGAKLGGSLQINSDVLNINNFDAGDITISGTGADMGKIWAIDAQNSAFWAGKITDETGTGVAVFNNTPTFLGTVTTPSLIVEDLTDGYIPYQKAADAKLSNSAGFTNGINTSFGGTDLNGKLTVSGSSGNHTSILNGTDLVINLSGAQTNGALIFANGITSKSFIYGDNDGYLEFHSGGINQNIGILTSGTGHVVMPVLKVTTGAGLNKVLLSDAVGLLNYSASALGTAAYTASGDYATAAQANATHSGDATGATALTLATVNANVGTYNNITINGKGLATAGSNVAYVTGTPWTGMGYLTAAITSLGGLSGASQTFAIGTTGTAPNWSSATTVHTLHIPMAATASVTAGLISKTEYDVFNGKEPAGTGHTEAAAHVAALLDSSPTFTGTITAADFCRTASDSTLKRNIKPFELSDFSKASKVQFHKFTFKNDPTSKIHAGVIAQELEQIIPELVYTDKKGIKSVSYTEMLVILSAQQAEEIRLLKEQNKEFEKRLEKLERNEK